MSAAEKLLQPDPLAMREALEWMAQQGQIHLVAIRPPADISGRDFGTDAEAAHAWAMQRNADSLGIYWSVNRVRAGLHSKPAKADISAARFVHVDLDPPKGATWTQEEKLKQIERLQEAKVYPSLIVDSGNGLHGYWRLEDDCTAHDVIEGINRALSADFTADACWNIDRILRVPGTINWPNAKKASAGREPCLASIVEREDGESSVEQLKAAFGWAEAPNKGSDRPNHPANDESLGTDLITPDDLGLSASDELRSAIEYPPGNDRSGDGLAVARLMANSKFADEQILGILLNPANAVSAHFLDQRDPRRAALRAIAFVRSNDGERSSKTDAQTDKTKADAVPLLQDSATFCDARTPADYLIDGSVRDGWLYTLTAPTGHGKSAVALAITYAIAKGGFLGSHAIKQGRVLFLAGENPDDIRERWIAMCERGGDKPADMPVTFMPGVWGLKRSLPVLRERFERNPLRLVVVDTLAAFFDGDNENDNAQQQEFATHVLRPLTELPGRPAVIVPAHPTKGAGKDSLTPKGGSSLLNAIDGNLSAWISDDTVKVHWQGKFRGAPWSPMHFELSEYRSYTLRDSRGRIMPTVVARALLQDEISTATKQGVKIENQVLKLVSDGLSIREIADEVYADGKRGTSKSRVQRVISSLAEQRWLKKHGRKWALTEQGAAVLKQAADAIDEDA